MAVSTPPPLRLEQSPYQSYVYSYPHKMAYRPFPDRSLSEIWEKEDQSALFLYLHIPFCEMRCGFCNLFTTVNHRQEFYETYIQTLRRQAMRVKAGLRSPQFARLAVGGGTPTQLPLSLLAEVFEIAEGIMGAEVRTIPSSVEVSPLTATVEKLKLLKQWHTTRISIGVQSFIDKEVQATQRKQSSQQVKETLHHIKEAQFPVLNIDLIYGLPDQTITSWLESLKTALVFEPEELYLYPLYVRPLTGLGLSDQEWDDHRLACYKTGRDFLLANGYTQVSMRMFQKRSQSAASGPVYCCQSDGMVGLGCGARSYTQDVHYSNDYAVGAKEVRGILEDYIQRPDREFDIANYGYILNLEDQQRRFILLSLLSEEGFHLKRYHQRFGSNPLEDYPQLDQLTKDNLATLSTDQLNLTPQGIEYSDAIGPWLFSSQVQDKMSQYQLK